jgi:hypothetical protein
MKIEELVGSLQAYEYSLPQVRKAKAIPLKASKKKNIISSDEDSDSEEDTVAMLTKNFRRLMKKFSERLKGDPKRTQP